MCKLFNLTSRKITKLIGEVVGGGMVFYNPDGWLYDFKSCVEGLLDLRQPTTSLPFGRSGPRWGRPGPGRLRDVLLSP